MRDCFFGELRLILVIELVSKWEICWALWGLVVFDPNDNPTRDDVTWFLMGDFLRLSLWSGGLGRGEEAWACCESCMLDIETVILVIRIFLI